MEFKVFRTFGKSSDFIVDIGTEWNLKIITTREVGNQTTVDIGTEWNLKILMPRIFFPFSSLI